MVENHEKEQYFFDDQTKIHLTNFIKEFENPCLLCAPTVGRELVKLNVHCHILDIDTRFSDLAGFHHYDILKPRNINEKFGIILCDPPFFTATFSQLFKAIHLLSHFDTSQPLLISYLTRRAKRFLSIFASFNLCSTEYFPTYETVEFNKKNEIEFYGNLSESQIKRLNIKDQ